MDKANYHSWEFVNDFKLPDAAYLWRGYEPQPEIPLSEDEKKGQSWVFRHITGPSGYLKPPTLPPIVREKLHQFIKDIHAGKLRLRDYGADDLPAEITWFAENEIRPDSILELMSIYVTRKGLGDYAEAVREEPEFLFSKKKHGLNAQQKEIVDKICLEMKQIYESFQRKNGGPGVGKQDTATPENWRKTALRNMKEHDYRYIRSLHFPDRVYSVAGNNPGRDLVVKPIQEVFKEYNLPTGSPDEIIKYYRQVTGKNRKQTKQTCLF